ncbi:MAG TPA: radical SAM protein [Desulfomonilaceae bacterium]|nr:radical SAM protein [Desulfomonilaceae bacterium]
MPSNSLSVILNPTYRCNADCEYCFENRTSDVMELEDFECIFRKIADYLRQQEVSDLKLHWEGGEIFTMEPEWLLRAHDISGEISEKTGLRINHRLQTNLIGYGPRWRRIVREMFCDEIGSSLDYPNLYRKVLGGDPESFNTTWFRRYEEARDAGIQIGVITLPNKASLSVGAERFYSYYVEDLGIASFQINTPYPGGRPTPAKRSFPLDNELLSTFYSDLFDLWIRHGLCEDVPINPFNELVHYFRTGENKSYCTWAENCSCKFVGIGPKGAVGQCEDWVSNHPEYVFGNILEGGTMAEIMNGPVRERFLQRPARLFDEEDCAECEYWNLCHGGCPVRAYSSTGNLFAKDPYCQSSKTLFDCARNAARALDLVEICRLVLEPPDSGQ